MLFFLKSFFYSSHCFFWITCFTFYNLSCQRLCSEVFICQGEALSWWWEALCVSWRWGWAGVSSGPVLSANFLTEDFLRLMCENLFLWSSWLIFPKEVPVVFCLERWWVMFKPGCWRSGARLGKRGVKVSVFFLILMMACYLSTGCPHPVSPEHLWLHVCRESPLCDGLGVVVV